MSIEPTKLTKPASVSGLKTKISTTPISRKPRADTSLDHEDDDWFPATVRVTRVVSEHIDSDYDMM